MGDWTWDPEAERQGIADYDKRLAEINEIAGRVDPQLALEASNIIRYYPHIQPDILVSMSLAGMTADMPQLAEVMDMQERQKESWWVRNVYNNIKAASRWGFAATESVYNSMPHTQGLRALTGVAQGLTPWEAFQQSTGTQLGEIQRAEMEGRDWTMGEGWFAQPQDLEDNPDYQKAYRAEIDRQIAEGRTPGQLDLPRAHYIAQAGLPTDIAQSAIDQAERIQLTSRKGGEPVPVSMGSVIATQFMRPGTAPYMIFSGAVDLPFRVGADPLNVPFWRWEEYWSAARSAVVAGKRSGLLDVAESIPPELGFEVRAGGRTYSNVDEFGARFNELMAKHRLDSPNRATQAEMEELAEMQSVTTPGSAPGEIWRGWLSQQARSSLPPGAESMDPARQAAVERISAVPVPPGVVIPEGATPHLVLVDRPMASAGGWAQKKGYLNRLARSDLDNATARVEATVATHVPRVNTQGDRDTVFNLITSTDELNPAQESIVETFILNANDSDFAWFDWNRTQLESAIDEGMAAEAQAIDADRQIMARGTWEAERQASGIDALPYHEQRIADLEGNLAPREAIAGIDYDVGYSIDEMPPATSAETQAAAPTPTTDPGDYEAAMGRQAAAMAKRDKAIDLGPVPERRPLEPGQRETLQEELDELDSELAERGMDRAENVNEGFGSAEDEAEYWERVEAEEGPMQARRDEIARILAEGVQPEGSAPTLARAPDTEVPPGTVAPDFTRAPIYGERGSAAPARGPYRSHVGDIWDYEGADAIVVTTNGFVTSRGRGVMGAGIAKEAKTRYPGLEEALGEHLRTKGNVVGVIGHTEDGTPIVAFPVKPTGTSQVPGFKMDASPGLISQSVDQLRALATEQGWANVIMPPPGTGNGRLPMETVLPLLDPLDERFIVGDFRPLPGREAAPAAAAPAAAAPAEEVAAAPGATAFEEGAAPPPGERRIVPPNRNPPPGITYQGRVKTINYDVDIDAEDFLVDRTRRRVMITGTRNLEAMDEATVEYIIAQIASQDPEAVIVHGMADGVDTWADQIAQRYGLRVERHPVSGKTWRRVGRSAGNKRNERMVRTGVDEVFAFPQEAYASGEPSGTINARTFAEDRGIPTTTVRMGQQLDIELEGMGAMGRGSYSGAPPAPITDAQVDAWEGMIENIDKRSIPKVVRQALIDAKRTDELAAIDTAIDDLGPHRADLNASDVEDSDLVEDLARIRNNIGRFEGSKAEATDVIPWGTGTPAPAPSLPRGVRRIQPREPANAPAYFVDENDNVLGTEWLGKPELAPEGTYRPPTTERPIEAERAGLPMRVGENGARRRVRARLPDVGKKSVDDWWEGRGAAMFAEDAGEAGLIEPEMLEEISNAAARELGVTLAPDPESTATAAQVDVAEYLEQLMGSRLWNKEWVQEWWDKAADRLRDRGVEGRNGVMRSEINRFLDQEFGPQRLVSSGQITYATKRIERRLRYLDNKASLNGVELAERDQLRGIHDRLPGSATTRPQPMADPVKTGGLSAESWQMIGDDIEDLQTKTGVQVGKPEKMRGRRVKAPMMFDQIPPARYGEWAETAITPTRLEQLRNLITRPGNRVVTEVSDTAQKAAYRARQEFAYRYGYLQDLAKRLVRRYEEGDPEIVALVQGRARDAENWSRRQLVQLTTAELQEKRRLGHLLGLDDRTFAQKVAFNLEATASDLDSPGYAGLRLVTPDPPEIDLARVRSVVKERRAAANREIKRLRAMAKEGENVAHSLPAAVADAARYSELARMDDEALQAAAAVGNAPVAREEAAGTTSRFFIGLDDEMHPLTPENIDVPAVRKRLQDEFNAMHVNQGDYRRGTPVAAGPTEQVGSQMEPVGPVTEAPREVAGPVIFRQVLDDDLNEEMARLQRFASAYGIKGVPPPKPRARTLAGERMLSEPGIVSPTGQVVDVKYTDVTDPNVVYIGRSPRYGPKGGPDGHGWGNQFTTGSRESRVSRYRAWAWNKARTDPEFRSLVAELHGKTLACHCAPDHCHGDVLSEIATWAKRAIDEGVEGAPAAAAIQPPGSTPRLLSLPDGTPVDQAGFRAWLAGVTAPEGKTGLPIKPRDKVGMMQVVYGLDDLDIPLESVLGDKVVLYGSEWAPGAIGKGMIQGAGVPLVQRVGKAGKGVGLARQLGPADFDADKVRAAAAQAFTDPMPLAERLPPAPPGRRPFDLEDDEMAARMAMGEEPGVEGEIPLDEEEAMAARMGMAAAPVPEAAQGTPGVPEAPDEALELAEEEAMAARLAGAAPPVEPPPPPAAGVTGPDPDDEDLLAELEHMRNERDRINQWIADHPEPPVVDPVGDDVIARRNAGVSAADVHRALAGFLDRVRGREPADALIDLATTPSVANELRRVGVDELAADMGRTPEQAAETLGWMSDVGLVRQHPDGRYQLTHSDPTDAQRYFDHLTELSPYGDELAMMNDDPELMAATSQWKRDVISTAADEQLTRTLATYITEPIEPLTGEWAHDFGVLGKRTKRIQDITELADDIADEALAEVVAANRDVLGDRVEDVLSYIGFDRRAFKRRFRERLTAWSNIAARDYAQVTEIRRLARGLARKVGKADDPTEIQWMAQKLLEASVNGLKTSPIGPGAAEFEASIMKGSDGPRRADDVRASVASMADGFSYQRRPFQNPRTADTQLDSPGMQRLISWIADTDSPDDISRYFADIPVDQLRRLVVANDPAVVREILREMWGIQIRNVPSPRRTSGQYLAGRTGPNARDRVARRPASTYLTAPETDDLVDLLSRQQELTEAEAKRLTAFVSRRSGRGAAMADVQRDASFGSMDLPGASIAKDYNPMSMWRTRWISEGGSEDVVLDADNIPVTLEKVRNWLDTVGADRNSRDRLLRKVLFADDQMSTWSGIGLEAREVLKKALVANGVPADDADRILKKFSWYRAQAELFHTDLAGNVTRTMRHKDYMGFGGRNQETTHLIAPEPSIEAELARRHPVLPSVTDVRRATSAYRRFVSDATRVTAGGTRLGLEPSKIQTGLNVAMGVWKDGALLRFGWPVKIVLDELARIAAVGYAEFMLPWSLIAYVAGRGDTSVIGGSITDQAEAAGGVGIGLQSNLKTGSPLVGTPFSPTDRNWEMGVANSELGGQSMLHRLEMFHTSEMPRRVAAMGVAKAFDYYTGTSSGRQHLADVVRRVEPGTRLSTIADKTDNWANLRAELNWQDAQLAQAAGGRYRYRPRVEGPEGGKLGPWTYNTGTEVPYTDIPNVPLGTEVVVDDPGFQWVRDLVARGHTGTRRPDESVWALIDSVLAGDAETSWRYYPIPADDSTAFGLEGYDATRVVDTFAEAEKVAGKGGRVAFLTQGQARRLANEQRRTGFTLNDIVLAGDETEPTKVALSAIEEYRSGGHHLLDVPTGSEVAVVDEPADIYFDVQLDGRERTGMAEALRRRFTAEQIDPATGMTNEIWNGPTNIPVPRAEPVSLTKLRNGREWAYNLFGAAPTKIFSRHPFLRMTYWDETARHYIFATDPVRTELLAAADEAGMADDFQRLVTRQMRSYGYAELPVGARTSHNMDLVDIDNIATHVAASRVRDLLYDLTKTGNIADAARLIAPFGDAWWEVLTRWSRLMSPIRNPRAARNWRRVEQTFNEMGQSGWLEEDQYGNEVFTFPSAMSFLSNVGLGGVYDPQSLLFVDPTSAHGLMPGASPPLQMAASFLTPHLPPEVRDFTNTAVFGEFPPTDNTFTAMLKAWLPTPYKRVVEGLFADQNAEVLGDTKAKVMMALFASGNPLYDYTTAEGRLAAKDAADSAGTYLTVARLFTAFAFPGSPRYEAMLKVNQDYLDGTIGEEWILLAGIQQEYQAALEFYGNDSDAYAYIVETLGPDPLALTGKSQRILDRPLTREPWDFMIAHGELERYAETTLAAFLPSDPDGDFFELAFRDAFHKGTRVEVNLDMIGQSASISAGWLAKEQTNAHFDVLQKQAVDMLGYGTEAYYLYMRELRTARKNEMANHTAVFFAGSSEGDMWGEVSRPDRQTMLDELVRIGTPGTDAYENLRPINPDYVDALTALGSLLAQAEQMTPPSPDRTPTWWMTSEYGETPEGLAREGNFIKEAFVAGLNDINTQMVARGPDAQNAWVWAVNNVVAPLLKGFEASETWMPQPVQWPSLNPAALSTMLADETPVPDGISSPAYTSTP